MTLSVEERFWAKVDQTGDCWEWTASKRESGYGQFSVGPGTRPRAHRVAWELTVGPIPEGMWVLHRCDNPGCVRPDHLFLGTPKDNTADMFAKGRAVPNMSLRPRTRSRPGSSNGNARLAPSDVDEIRRRYAQRRYGDVRDMCRQFGITRGQVHRIGTGQAWATAA